jgi:hypothetical protein
VSARTASTMRHRMWGMSARPVPTLPREPE